MRLSHEGRLTEFTVQESILNIELSNGPRAVYNNGEDESDCLGLDHWAVGLFVIKTKLLMKTLGHKLRLVALG